MDYKHEEETVLMQYGGGDPCPPGTSAATLNEYHEGTRDQVQSSVNSHVGRLLGQTLTEHSNCPNQYN